MLTPELKTALLGTPLCQELNPSELDLLIAHNKIISFSPGEIIIRQGHKTEGMYVIIEGVAIASARSLEDTITDIATVKYGDLVGEVTLIEKVPTAISVIASTPVQCLLISNVYFDLLAYFYPETKHKITKTIVKQVIQRIKMIDQNIIESIEKLDMEKRSILGEVIKSLNKPATIKYQEAKIDIAQFLSADYFKSFTNEEVEFLLKQGELIDAPKHCTIIEAGHKNLPCHVVLHGAVESNIVHKNKIAKLSVISPYILFASLTSIDQNESSIINFTTCEHAILLKISVAFMDSIKQNNSKLWYKLFDLICKSLVALEKSVDKLEVRLNVESYNR